MNFKKVLNILASLIVMASLTSFAPFATQAVSAQTPPSRTGCDDNQALCTETNKLLSYEGKYIGHDEPSLLFYSNTAGSGNSNVYQLTLPKDPPALPKQDGTGGTFNFQLHPAFWFGMAMCDTQSDPNFTNVCTPDSDANIFDNPDPHAADYMGHHPGGAYMEMQFYPPGWAPWPAGVSCDATKWCAALNIDSLSTNPTQINNSACLETAGLEYVNFAFITRSGVSQAPADPTQVFQPPFAAITPNPSVDLMMKSGDQLVVSMHDTPAGFQVVIKDTSSGQSGSMTASIRNGFAQVKFDPNGTTCQSLPYAFHPMYATSSEHTHLTWTAHSYNVAFSDEIGHFEYCNAADPNSGACTSAGVNDAGGLDGDDFQCFNPSDSTRVQVGGCIFTDTDFDGPEYANNWPGTFTNPVKDHKFHPSSVLFSSPLFRPSGGGQLKNFNRVAFETDLAAIESFGDPSNNCDIFSGAGCVNPPNGASFYPIYSTNNSQGNNSQGNNSQGNNSQGACLWQLGGAHIPGTVNTFGGNSTTEYGPLLLSTYYDPGPTGFIQIYENFRRILNNNPCPASQGEGNSQ